MSVLSPVVIGVDGGGSKTLLAAVDREGAVVRLLRDAGSNPFDAPDWRDVLDRLGQGAADLAPRTAHAVFGLPGYGEVGETTAAQDAAVAAAAFATWSVLNDVEAACEGAFAGGSGILLLAGTGSMVWARRSDGSSHRVGGWGEAFGDEGSAFWIGREVVARVSRALDGRLAARDLAEALFQHLGLEMARPHHALMRWYMGHVHARSGIAALATFADKAAARGQPAAVAILDEAADHLALHVEAARRAFGETLPRGEALPWSYAGGAFQSAALLERVTARLGSEPLKPVLPPIGGALLRAATRAGWEPGLSWFARLRAELAHHLDH